METMSPDIDRMTADLSTLVSIPSVNPYDDPPAAGRREAEVADWLQRAMEQIGLETGRRDVVPGRPNVWGRLRGTGGGPCLMLAGHMDTVDVDGYQGDPFAGVVHGTRLHGRGATDMKASLAVFLEVARQLATCGSKLAGDLLLMFVVDEEHVMIGSKDAGNGGPHADFCIVGEPTELAVCPAHKGQTVFEISTFGTATHSSMPERGVNAISHMMRVMSVLDSYSSSLAERVPHPLCGLARVSAVQIRGGQSHSAIPERCDLMVDRRTLPGETAGSISDELRALMAPLESDGLRWDLSDPILDVAPLDTPANAPITAACHSAAEHVTGTRQPLSAFPGGTDGPNFGCPAVICGPGSLAQAHTSDEFVEIGQLESAAEIYLNVARALCGAPAG